MAEAPDPGTGDNQGAVAFLPGLVSIAVWGWRAVGCVVPRGLHSVTVARKPETSDCVPGQTLVRITWGIVLGWISNLVPGHWFTLSRTRERGLQPSRWV